MFDSSIIKMRKKIQRKFHSIYGKIQGNSINTFWYLKNKNFGDLLNPDILRYYGFTPLNISKNAADVITSGSILQSLPKSFSGYIIGSGLIDDRKLELPNAKILSVRGELTRERINANKNTPLGDPGLLISLIYPKREEKIYILGIVPHYIDKKNATIQKIQKRYPREIKIIDVQRKPQKVVNEIDQCENILSSSLHGVIAADSLSIRNGWLQLSQKVRGGGFKFYDYASALDRSINPHFLSGEETLSQLIEMTRIINYDVSQRRSILDEIFKKFAREFPNELRENLLSTQ